MRLLTFDQFHAEPEGVLFRFDLPVGAGRHGPGLFRKGKSWAAGEGSDNKQDDNDDPAMVTVYDIHTIPFNMTEIPGDSCEAIYESDCDDEACIAVYEPADLGRLAGWIRGAMQAAGHSLDWEVR